MIFSFTGAYHISGSCVLTCGVGVASLLGLVPDGHAVVLQFEVALFLPGARLDFPHYCPNKHGLEVVIPLDAWNQEGRVFVNGVSISCLILNVVLIRPLQTWKQKFNLFFSITFCPIWALLVKNCSQVTKYWCLSLVSQSMSIWFGEIQQTTGSSSWTLTAPY